jgi:uncharacterized membrane protein
MHTRYFIKIIVFAIVVIFSSRAAITCAATIPSDVYSHPVSIAFPTPVVVFSKPLSIGFQAQTLYSALNPTIAPVSKTKLQSVTLTGSKQANTSLYFNGQLTTAPFADVAWSLPVNLSTEGTNSFSFFVRDGAGNQSQTVTATVVRDTTPPLFTIDNYITPTISVTQTISGQKEAGAVVSMNGTTIFTATDQNSTWSYPITLIDGLTNHLVFNATDEVGNITTKVIDILCNTSRPQPLAAGMLVADGSGRGNEVSLSWPSYIEPADLGYYRIYYRSFTPTNPFTTVTGLTPAGTVNRSNKAFKVTGLSLGTSYVFAVVPVSISGGADPEVHSAQATPADTMPPEEVTNLAGTASYSVVNGNQVSLAWTPSLDSRGDLDKQLVYMDAGDNAGYVVIGELEKTATSFTKVNLADNKNYKFKITTRDTLLHESSGAVVTAVTRLANPAGLAATPGNQKVTLTWNALSSPYVKHYNLYRLPTTNQQTEITAMTLIKSQSSTTFTDTGLVNGTTYQYAVTTLNTSGAERTEVQSIATVPRGDTTGPVIGGLNLTANQVLTAPVTITASATDSESALSKIELYLDGVLVKSQNGAALSFALDVAAIIDGNHTVKITAYDEPGNKTDLIIPVVVSLAPPAMPVITTTFTAPINLKSATFTGTTQAGSTVSLRVNGVVVASVSATGTSFTFTSVSLTEGVNSVSAKASNRGGDSPFSADTKVTVVTAAPTAPGTLVAKALAGGSVQFTWQTGGSGTSGYNMYQIPESFTALTDSGVTKTNPSLIPYLLKEYIPADDNTQSYVVTAVDGAGNESPPSNLVTIASDRLAPAVNSVTFSDDTFVTHSDNIYGPGKVLVAITVSEALSETPFFSLELQQASPVVVSLRKVDDTHYSGSLTLDATSPHGATTWKLSAKDLVGNRGSSQGTGPIIDVKGPVASITTPVAILQTTSGPVQVALTFDEPSVSMPTLELRSGSIIAPVTGLATTDGGVHWNGTLDPSACGEGAAQFHLTGARDRFGNVGTTIKTGGSIILYSNTPPAPAVPQGFTVRAVKGGSLTLTWTKVPDALGYKVYRQGLALPVLVPATTTGSSASYTETPDSDGEYTYSVTAIGLLESESTHTVSVSAISDRAAPVIPTGLVLNMTGNGVKATWDAVTSPNEVPVSYRLYRSAAPISDTTGLTPVVEGKSNNATDAAPTTIQRFYAVTALDALGNESAPSAAQEISYPVAPVSSLVLTLVDDGKPTLSWDSGEAGFYIYRNGSKINQTPTSSKTYTDGYYSGGSVSYGVSAVDANGTESPVREVTLPTLSIGLKDGTSLRRGMLENVVVVAALPSEAANSITIDTITVQIGTLPESSLNGPFTVTPGVPLEIKKVTATEANAPSQEAVVVTAILRPSPGVVVNFSKTSLAAVLGSGTALEIFSEPLVRGTNGSVRIKVNNLGSALTEFITSENNGPTPNVTVSLKDQDGNLLAQGHLNQRIGDVINVSSVAIARIEPGGNFLSEPIIFNVPASAPYKVSIEVAIDNMYYHYQQDDQVIASGLKQAVDDSIADVSYSALASTDKQVYKQGEPVIITGQATSTATVTPMPFVPVKVGVSFKGFDRSFTVNADDKGLFSYTLVPASNETGIFDVWASHPDLAGRSGQSRFSIIGLAVDPPLATIAILKGQSFDIPVMLNNLGGSPLTAVSIIATGSNGVTASVVNQGTDTLAAGEQRSVLLRISAAVNAPNDGFASLNVVTAEGLSGKVDATISMVTAIPVINTTPSYIDTGLMRGNQKLVSFNLTNSGFGTLHNARIVGPSLSWLTLTDDKLLGNISVGQEKAVGIIIKPAETVAQGVYNDRLVIYSDNHIPYTYNIQVTVTSSAVGSVGFSLVKHLIDQNGTYPPIEGASITLQNQSVTEILYNLNTTADGTASITDIPEGRYSYTISSSGHKSFSGSVVVTPGVLTSLPVALEVNLVQVEWTVTPTTIQDQYQVTINQTFETNVPAPVLVAEPPGITVPRLAPGQVLNGEFTVTNYGLIAVEDIEVDFPKSYLDYDIEILSGTIPSRIEAKQTIRISYRITRRIVAASTVSLLYSEIHSYGGDCIGPLKFGIGGKCVICPNSPFERKIRAGLNWIISFFKDCPTHGNPIDLSKQTTGNPIDVLIPRQTSGNSQIGPAPTPLQSDKDGCIIPSPPCNGPGCAGSSSGDSPNSGGPNSGGPNSGGPNSGGPNSGGPNSGGPNSGGPNSGGPNSGGPNSGGPNSGGPNSGGPNSGGPNSGGPNSGGPNSGGPNSGGPNSGDPPSPGGPSPETC